MYEEIKGDLRIAYDKKVKERSGKTILSWKEKLNREFYNLITSEGKQKMLEIGAGTGVHGAFFQKLGLDVTCTDLSPAMVAHMRTLGLDAHEMDFGKLTFPAESFDVVFAMNCLLHVPHADFGRIMDSVSHVLKPGGLFLLCQYGGIDDEGPYADDHYEPKRFFAFWTDEQIKIEVKKVFKVESFQTVEIADTSAPEIHSQVLILRK